MTTDAIRRGRALAPATGLLLLLAILLAAAPVTRAEEGEAKEGPPKLPFAPGKVNLAFTETVGDVVVRQYELEPMSHLSYLVGSGGKAVVVDPLRDVDRYLEDAKRLGLEIEVVILTHSHTDFLAGHNELATRTGAKVLVNADMPATFEHEDVPEGATWEMGEARFEFLHTPGPTNDGMTVLVHAKKTSVRPLYALCGDALYVHDLGRPEALAGRPNAMALAEKAFDSVQQLKLLPDQTRVLPGHGGGPFRGRDLGEPTLAMMNQVKALNPFAKTESRAAFVTRVLSHLPSKTPFADRLLAANLAGPSLAKPDAPPGAPPTSVDALAAALAKGAWLVDLRMPRAYADGHVKGAVNIPISGRLETWYARVIPQDAETYLLGTDAEVDETLLRLRRTGIEAVAGRVAGGMEAWTQAGRPVKQSLLISPKELKRRMDAWIEPVLVDVRGTKPYLALRLGDIANIPLTKPARFRALLDLKRPLLTICKVGFRSTIAVGLLERMGFERVGSLAGGMQAWVKDGLPTLSTK